MLVVKVEIWPHGRAESLFEIARLGIGNVTPGEPVADYRMTGLLDRDKRERAVQCEINKHERDLGWEPLVRRAVSNLILSAELLQEIPYDDPVARLLRKGSHE